MINYNYVRKLKENIGIPEETIEKDYLTELLLGYLAVNKFLERHLVFRGGTALKKIYFPEFRYSEDLDFVIKPSGNLRNYEETFDGLIEKIREETPIEINVEGSQYPQKGHLQLFLPYNIVPEIRSEKKLKIDIIEDKSVLQSRKRRITFSFNDFENLNRSLNTYNIESISAEKILRIMDVVDEPRDLWDLLFLLKSGAKIDVIKEAFIEKTGTTIDISNLIRVIQNPNYQNTWDIRLKNQIPKLIEYEDTIEELEFLIKTKFIQRNDDQ